MTKPTRHGLTTYLLHGDHILGLRIGKQRCHSLRMRLANMRVSGKDKLATIFMTLELGDRLHVNAQFKAAGHEHSAE